MIPTHLRPHISALAMLALPLIGANVARLLIAVSDTMVVGRYGVDHLAALVLATSYHLMLFLLGAGYAIGLMGVLAAALARGDGAEVRRATRMTFWLSALHSVAVMPLMWWSGPIFLALGQEPRVAMLAQEFLRIYGLATMPLLWGMTLNSYLATLGRANTVLWVTLGGLPVNVALNVILVFGMLGAPELGVAGSALAGLIVNWLLVAILIAYALWLPKARRFAMGQNPWRPDWEAFFRIFHLGLPVGLTLVAESGMFTGANLLMGLIGATALAAHGIALQLVALAFMVHLGLGAAATIRVGEAAGHRDMPSIADNARAAILLSAIVAILTAALFILMPHTLAGFYLDPDKPSTPEILGLTAKLLLWAGIFQLADGQQAVALGLLRGIQDTRAPMLLAGIAYWLIGLPTAYVVGILLGFGPQGIWFGLLIGLVMAAVLLMLRFWRGRQRGDWTRAGGAA